MEELDNISLVDAPELISALPKYQQHIVNKLIQQNGDDYLGAAEGWLNASMSNMTRFGGQGQNTTYRKALMEELEKYLCGDAFYEKDRQKLNKIAHKTYPVVIGAITMAIAPVVGVAAPFLTPAIVLLILSMGKMSVNAWCRMRKQE